MGCNSPVSVAAQCLILTKQIGVIMNSQRENAIQKIIIFMRNRMAVSTRSLEDVLTLAQEHDILLEDVLKYWKEQVFNV